MSSSSKLYHHVMAMLKPISWQGRKETLQTLALMMTAIFQSGDVRLGRIARKVPLPIKQDSVEQRFRRWLKNPHIDERVIYDPIARGLLFSLRRTRLRIQMDRTLIGDQFNILKVTLYWRKRALPLVWQVLPHQGSSGYADWAALLGHLRTLMPPDAQVTVLGDREFGTADMMVLVREQGWDYCLRVKGDQLIWDQSTQQWCQLRDLIEPGETHFLHDVYYTKANHYRTHFALTFDKNADEPCLVATNRTPSPRTLNEYRKRFGCEPFFSDLKSRGFDMARTQLQHRDRFSRLLLVLVLLAIWLIGVGQQLTMTRRGQEVIRPSQVSRFSLFQIGYRWLDKQLTLARSLWPHPDYCLGQLI
jgi:hypothetical protein